MTNSFWMLAFLVLGLDAQSANAPPPSKAPASYPFTFDTLQQDAERRAAKPYAPQHNSLSAVFDKLSPEQYRSIHFNPNAGIWLTEKLPFRLELLRAGYNLPSTVTVSTVENGVAKDVIATPAMFQMASALPAQLGKTSLPVSGFRIRSRINSKKIWDEFLVFQGASYFRAVAQNLLYGLSARGLAINTAEPTGEEFPVFTHFWIEQPAARASAIVIYALLESESTTGAYRFTVQPGVETQMDVELTL
jgi:glucans biosynthesis protein